MVVTDSETGFSCKSAAVAKVTAQKEGFTTDLRDMKYNMADTPSETDFAVTANAGGTLTWYYNTASASQTGAVELYKQDTYAAGSSASPAWLPTKPTSTTADTSYYLFAKLKTASGSEYTSKIAKVTFSLKPAFDTSASAYNMSDAVYAVGQTAATLNTKVTGAGTGATYQWYKNTTGTADKSVDTKIGTGKESYTPTIGTAAATEYYYCVATQNGQSVTSKIAKITTVSAFAFTKQPASKTVVLDQDAVLTLAYNLTNIDSLKWYTSTTATTPTTASELTVALNAGTAAEVTSGASGSRVITDTTTVGEHYYFAAATVGSSEYFTNCATVAVTPMAKGVKFTSGSLKYKVTTAKVSGGNVHAYAPKSTKYKSITVPSTVMVGGFIYKVTGIDSKAFYKSKKISKVYVKATGLSSIGSKAFTKCKKGCKFYLPKAKYSKYKKLLKGKVPAKAKYYKKY